MNIRLYNQAPHAGIVAVPEVERAADARARLVDDCARLNRPLLAKPLPAPAELPRAISALLIQLSSLLERLSRSRERLPTLVDKSPAYPSSKAIGEAPADIWSGFYQSVEGNCVTVSAIKAAMMRFGQNPLGIYREIHATDQGYAVTTRDGKVLAVSHAELRLAARHSGFKGHDAGMLKDANFLYAVSAKRAQLENHEGAGKSFKAALDSLNDGELPGEGFRRLGLFAYMRHATRQELADGALGTLAYNGHSVAVIGSHEERYGIKWNAPPADLHHYQAIKLV
ncbi:hypothetical protein [Pseudomonas mucidolens]|uniref:Uncharacterized protein n=1 Tax=Pseudomonas mucidolens TaxID=46679 RepID=A0A1H2M820_9PSED|nr:hypothetical protein [Pseudomonas mucidolens]SDU88656.1 hypothetical protein SAMN05216202_1097 [Pseudomonas mucidolens]SQH34466.1 type III secretion effector protein [Pseudomonas mucidolens]